MSIPNNNSKFVSMLLVLLSLFIFVFFTKWFYSDLIATTTSYDANKSTHVSQLSEIDILEKKQKELQQLDGSNNNEIGKYLQQPNEDEIFNELYSFTTNYDGSNAWDIKIQSITMTEWVKNEFWFNESNINISARVENKDVMIDFLDFLIKDSKYKFYINSFSLPKDKDKFFNIQVPLTLFYKEYTKTVVAEEKTN